MTICPSNLTGSKFFSFLISTAEVLTTMKKSNTESI